MNKVGGRALLLSLVWVLFAAVPAAADEQERLIVRAPKPYDSLVSAVRGLGGDIHHLYVNVDALAVSIPSHRVADLATLVGPRRMTKDATVHAPRPVEQVTIAASEVEAVEALHSERLAQLVSSHPTNFNFNNRLTGAATLHSQGVTGHGVVVAVIDTGTANSPVVGALSGTVVGGENFVRDDPVTSATSRRNHPHGTWVGSMIAAHATFLFDNTSSLVRSLRIHAPDSVIACTGFPPPCSATRSIVPVIGTAPSARIYAFKVFDSRTGAGRNSDIIAAMDRAITLRRNYDRGVSSNPVAGNGSEEDPFVFDSLNIQIVNMSLGGGTFFAGRELKDQLTVRMLEIGMTIVASAGNSGPAAMTGGSPGTGIGTLTVGAASSAVHQRVFRDVQFGVGNGALFRPTGHVQTAPFSSRGPTADGRIKPEVVANGVASFVQGTCLALDLVSDRNACLAGLIPAPLSFEAGTSFASPTVAGAAALLRERAPAASAVQIRNALVETANPSLLGDGSGPIDQGAGFIDIPVAMARLQAGRVSSHLARTGRGGSDDDDFAEDDVSRMVEANIREAGFRPVSFRRDRFTSRVEGLRPGQVAHFFVDADERTDQLVVSLTNVTPELPRSQQNVFFGDSVFLQVVDALTSDADTKVSAEVAGDSTFTIANPQTGLVRVAVRGTSTNAGRISADLTIERTRRSQGQATAEGRVAEGELVPFEIEVPAGSAQAVFELSWNGNWSRYPTNGLDLILIDPAGAVSFAEPTFARSPQRAVINNPAAGTWTAFVLGDVVFDHDAGDDEDRDDEDNHDARSAKERFELRVTVDGNRLRMPGADR